MRYWQNSLSGCWHNCELLSPRIGVGLPPSLWWLEGWLQWWVCRAVDCLVLLCTLRADMVVFTVGDSAMPIIPREPCLVATSSLFSSLPLTPVLIDQEVACMQGTACSAWISWQWSCWQLTGRTWCHMSAIPFRHTTWPHEVTWFGRPVTAGSFLHNNGGQSTVPSSVYQTPSADSALVAHLRCWHRPPCCTSSLPPCYSVVAGGEFLLASLEWRCHLQLCHHLLWKVRPRLSLVLSSMDQQSGCTLGRSSKLSCILGELIANKLAPLRRQPPCALWDDNVAAPLSQTMCA